MSEPDLSKIVSLIMENPSLIEEIRALTKGSEHQSEQKTEHQTTENSEYVLQAEPEEAETEQSTPVFQNEENNRKIKRRELLMALKPYISRERSQVIDTMLSVLEIVDLMKTR
jgi:hypothetical protein